MFVFAQLSTSVSDDQIRLIIIALLVVAVLLAALTTWYFVKTSPTRRVRAAQARRQAQSGQGQTGAEAHRTAGPTGASAGGAAASTPRPSATAPAANRMVETDSGDEWERLTAPEPRRQASN